MALVQCIRVQVVLNPSEAPADHIVNTWHCASVDATTPAAATASFVTKLNTFYQAIDAQLTADLHTQVPYYKAYNLLEVKPRQPIDEGNLTALSTGNGRLPREIACCLTYKAQFVSGISPRRRRGRIYLGPLKDAFVDDTTGLFATTSVQAIQTAADALVTDSIAATTWKWVLYSPTTDTNGTGEDGMYEVIGGYVDTLPDVQRRRGVRAGTRYAFS